MIEHISTGTDSFTLDSTSYETKYYAEIGTVFVIPFCAYYSW